MSLLILDNYDSFTYNLAELVRQCHYTDFKVVRNDEIGLAEVEQFDRILVSPGPGLPSESGITKEIIHEFAVSKKILGICLGHQAIAEVFGGTLYQLDRVCHGLVAEISVIDNADTLFDGLVSPFPAGLYHSWAVAEVKLPDCLIITARSADGVIMGIRHKEYNVRGIQFHPESIMTPMGVQMIGNWLRNP